MPNTNINIRIDADVKATAQKLFANLGMDLSTAVNIFIRQAIAYGGIPFPIKQPRYNPETEAAIKEAREIAEGKVPSKAYSSAAELFMELDKEC